MTITIGFDVNGSAAPAARYLTWTPYPARVRLTGGGANGPVTALLRNADGNVGRLAFRERAGEDGEAQMSLALPADGSPVELLISGEFQAPSIDDGDAVLEVVVDHVVVARLPFMVRIRKDAETLTGRERDRFVAAFAELNTSGGFRAFHAMHTEDTNAEAHSLDAFLPWHRCYLLDLERALQALDPAVVLPYWRFDRPAPGLFSEDFFGAPAGPPAVVGGPQPRLSPSNPLRNWSIDGTAWVQRHPRYADPRVSAASPQPGRTVTPDRSILGLDIDYAYEDVAPPAEGEPGFRDYLESNPHGAAHVSFSGLIRSPGTAAGDPLFFLLHSNVDRIWAKWQWYRQRFDGHDPHTYFYRGRSGDPVRTRVGHNLLDTMWPWNGVTGSPRPATAPRHPLIGSPVVAGPPAEPIVGDLIDFQGHLGSAPGGFDYDDVPFEKRG